MKNIKYFLAGLLALFASLASASVVLQGTRIVYSANSKDASIVAENTGRQPALVQAWLDRGNDLQTLDAEETPFVITPPIFRLNPDKSQQLRIIYNNDPLPEDRESLFWLNVLEVPPKLADASSQNALRMTFRTRVKVFFRPAALSGDLRKAASEVQWELSKADDVVNISVKNPTPYHITITDVAVMIDGKEFKTDGEMVSPFGSVHLPLNGVKSTDGLTKVTYSFIDDQGANVTMESISN